ncbi:MAG: response regulator [Myxococcota bacterium]
METRTLIADDQGLFRAGLRRLLEELPDLRVVGEARDGCEAVDLTRECEATLVLMDVAMPQLSGIDATRRISESGEKVRVLIVSATESPARVQEALHAGAAGYLSKNATRQDLHAAVEALRQGGSYLSPRVARRLTHAMNEPSEPVVPLARLSAREREVLTWLAEGLSSREIGERLSVSPRTIDSHRVRLMKKLGIHKVQNLVRLAIREGLIEA